MTNEKLGVLLVDVPEPRFDEYTFLEYSAGSFSIVSAWHRSIVYKEAYHCTQEEAKKYPQFRRITLEEL